MLAPVSRLLDRFWLRAERALLDLPSDISQPVLTLAERGATAREAAARTSRPPTPFGNPGHAAIAAELYREAIHWALLAHGARRAERPATSAAPASELPKLLAAADRNLLRAAVESDKQLEELLSDLSRSYVEFAE
ncbi:MAG TPA: hypothetical protein VLJ38_08965, partial [Polyangiaceae bacterium]|nr:hypothetical protein [Polyangiaceae bacterium]